MSRVRDVTFLIDKYEERLEGLQEMAELEEVQRYGTACGTTVENQGYELSLCIDALKVYRDKLMEDEKAKPAVSK